MRTSILSLSIGVAALALYAATAAPSIVTFFDDTLEFQVVVPTLGIAHPTGYPLYTLVGALWSRVLFPVGNWAWRMNLFSAVMAAITIGLTVHLAAILFHRGETKSEEPGLEEPDAKVARLNAPNLPSDNGYAFAHPKWLNTVNSVTPAIAFGLNSPWWQQATVAEVYSLHGLFVVAILLMTLQIGREVRHQHRAVLGLCVLLGLSLTHHRTTLLLLPGIALYLYWRCPHLFRPQKVWIGWVAALLLPLLIYMYIPFRAGQGVMDLHGSYTNTMSGLYNHIFASSYSRFWGWSGPNVVQILVEQIGWWGVALAVWGGVVLVAVPLGGRLFQFLQLHVDTLLSNLRGASVEQSVQSSVSEWTLLFLVFITNLSFCFFYQVADIEVFLLPSLFAIVFFIIGGLDWLARRSFKRFPSLVWGYIPVSLFIGITPLVYNGFVDRRDTWMAHDLAVEMAKVNFVPESRFVGLEGEATALLYMQEAEKFAPNVIPLWANDETLRLQLVDQLMEQAYPVYISRELPGIEDRFSFSGEGPLVRVWPRGTIEPKTPERSLNIAYLDGTLLLDGIDVVRLEQAGGLSLRIMFYWRPQSELVNRIKLSLRFVDPISSEPIVSADGSAFISDHFPLQQVTFTEYWVPGEQIRDVYTLLIPTTTDEDSILHLPTLYNWLLSNLSSSHQNTDRLNPDNPNPVNLNTNNRNLVPWKLLVILYDANTVQELGRVLITP
ncbi:MAG: DUF2723 domain-containing protein [Chloroflexota bacterium]